jgi:uncharacterized membrane protein
MPAGTRREYLDWLRGVAVLIMIEAHLIDSWTGGPDRETSRFGLAMILGGMGAPLFLFLAGVAVPLSAESKLKKTGSVRAASNAVIRRGFEIFGLAFLFRLQAWILGWSSPRALLKVDILNIMGPAIAVAGALWGLGHSTRVRLGTFSLATLALVLLTPLIRTRSIGGLPDPIEAYIRPLPGLSNFVFFPWAGFAFAGAFVGVLLAGMARPKEGRINAWLFGSGLAIAGIAYGASYLPSPYPASNFWTTSPCYFFLRAGLMTAAVGAAYAWHLRPGGREKWSPLIQLGRSSLFIYWIHVEMVYGLISVRLHKALTLRQSLMALLFFCLFMLLCSIAKDRVVAWWRTSRSRPTPAPAT